MTSKWSPYGNEFDRDLAIGRGVPVEALISRLQTYPAGSTVRIVWSLLSVTGPTGRDLGYVHQVETAEAASGCPVPTRTQVSR